MAQPEATMPTWQAQQLAKKLENDIRQLNVAMAELDTVKPKKATYVKRANVFFLDRRDMIVKAKRSIVQVQRAFDKESQTRQDSITIMAKKLVVIGGAGALGRGISAHFSRSKAWKALSVDFSANADADASFVFDKSDGAGSSSTLAQASSVLQHIKSTYGRVDAVVCAAGGWAGGSIKDADTLTNLAQMHAMNTESAVLSAHLASNLLTPGGLLVLTGAAAAIKATPGMVSYGISKAGTHHLIASTVDALPEGSSVVGVLPATIDTPMNRKYMADADFSSWTKVEDIAAKILEWSEAPAASRPTSGHLITVLTENNKNAWKDVGNPFL